MVRSMLIASTRGRVPWHRKIWVRDNLWSWEFYLVQINTIMLNKQ
jgi:hypothetical protein